MEKENKKLESRQDVLDVWVSKWAMIWEETVKEWRFLYDIFRLMVTDTYKRDVQIWDYSIYEILYSPESNFFEVMFAYPFADEWLRSFWKQTLSDEIKKRCVTSFDPLIYLLDALNEIS